MLTVRLGLAAALFAGMLQTPPSTAPAAPGAPQTAPTTSSPSAAPPVLSDAQKVQVRLLTQQLEIASLRAQLAQADFEKTQTALRALVESWRVPGYELDVSTLSFVKLPEKPKGED
jgi:hypothetical protein